MQNEDERFMSIALQCAQRGRGAVEPNPMVGAVLVRDGVELARGWHKRFGFPHAEIEALSAATEAGRDAGGATMYVTLEPCCHSGKTPPCTDAMIEAGVARVVVAMEDPDRHVAGKGLAALREAGIEVVVGVLEAQARELLAAYVKLRTKGRPWVICKWAQTPEGCLALPPANGRWISGDEARAHVHQLRGLCDGVCVGIGTVLADDPLLTNRSGTGRSPHRVVLDSRLRLPTGSWLATSAEACPVIVATTTEAMTADLAKVGELRQLGVEVLDLSASPEGVDLGALLDELGRRQWTCLLVEGGAKVLRSFTHGRLADELVVFTSATRCEPAEGLPRFDVAEVLPELSPRLAEERRFGADVMRRFVVSA
ncbi:MAG TPA: bifunctional diaminohydroxyphosphoribosylaminopyrimidine deaminase/5-amino-6-(5-phosphoribosylamino)uracil reductase RibD [Phycisphaerae bacterium]|nr:bifunctional diaminohydroxyphosphoribosylaminopyrimidine deaminase/5-amino-6-(5-phosphoribosylamino)uracil reductase RibD [Phycisphaerae bacterium]